MFLGSHYYGPHKSRRLNELLRQFQPDVVNVHFPDNQIQSILNLQARFDLRPAPSANPAETAKRWAFPDGRGELGIIAPVSEPFCGHCNRIRLTADGKIRTCLFSVTEHDLRSLLRNGSSDVQIADWLKGVVWQKEARHHIGESDFVMPSRSRLLRTWSVFSI